MCLTPGIGALWLTPASAGCPQALEAGPSRTTSRTRRLSMNFRSRSYLSASELMPQGTNNGQGSTRRWRCLKQGFLPVPYLLPGLLWDPFWVLELLISGQNHTKQQWSVFEVLLAGSKFPGKEGRCWAAGVDLQDSALPWLLPPSKGGCAPASISSAAGHLGMVPASPEPPHSTFTSFPSYSGNIWMWREFICRLKGRFELKSG